MTLAEQIAAAVLRSAGFREPTGHDKWSEAVESAQHCIDRSVEAMARIAADNSPPSLRALLEYEVKSSWWAGWLPSEAMQDAAATYYAWKVKRKYARFQASTKKPIADSRNQR